MKYLFQFQIFKLGMSLLNIQAFFFFFLGIGGGKIERISVKPSFQCSLYKMTYTFSIFEHINLVQENFKHFKVKSKTFKHDGIKIFKIT